MPSRSQMSQSGTSKEDGEEIEFESKHDLRFILWNSISQKVEIKCNFRWPKLS